MNANFEQYARKQLSVHEVAVDTDALWADIYPQVKPKKGNRGIYWFFLLSLLVGLAFLGVLYNKNNTAPVADQHLSPAKEIKATTAVAATNQSVEKAIVAGATTDKAEKASLTEAKDKLPATVISNKKTTKEARIKGSNLNTASIAPIEATNISTALKKEDTAPARAIKSPVDASSIVAADKENKNPIVAETATAEANKDILGSLAKRAKVASAILPVLSPDLLTYEIGISEDLLEEMKTEPSIKLPAKDSKKKSRRRGSLFNDLQYGVGFYTGISRSNTDLESKLVSTDPDPYLVLRTNSEKQLETLHFGLSALVQAENNLYLRTGIEYSRIGSLFSRSSKRVEVDSMLGIVEYLIHPITGDTIEAIEGQIPVERTTEYTKKSYNYFHLVDVPVILGYNFGNYEDTWRIGVEAGIYANIYMKAKGEISSEDETFYDIENDNNGWYQNNVGISPFVGINVAYNVDNNIQLHFSPNFRFSSLFSTDKNPIEERHANLGVQAGIRYLFD